MTALDVQGWTDVHDVRTPMIGVEVHQSFALTRQNSVNGHVGRMLRRKETPQLPTLDEKASFQEAATVVSLQSHGYM